MDAGCVGCVSLNDPPHTGESRCRLQRPRPARRVRPAASAEVPHPVPCLCTERGGTLPEASFRIPSRGVLTTPICRVQRTFRVGRGSSRPPGGCPVPLGSVSAAGAWTSSGDSQACLLLLPDGENNKKTKTHA